jgi:hypothetical protein
MNNSEKFGSARSIRTMVVLSTRVTMESSKALAVEMRRGRPVREPSPMKSPALERDDCFLTLGRHDRDFDPAFSNVEDGIGGVTLVEYDLTLPVPGDGDAAIRFGEKCLRIEFGL